MPTRTRNQPPIIDKELVAYLAEQFPDAAVDPSREDPAIAYGSALVVRHLAHLHEEQQQDPFDDVYT